MAIETTVKGTVISLPQAAEVPGINHVSVWTSLAAGIRGSLAALFHWDYVLMNLLGFLLGRVLIMNELAPFGLAYFLAMARTYRPHSPAIGLWVLAGALTAGYYIEATLYCACMILYFFLTDAYNRLYPRLRIMPLLLFFSSVAGVLIAFFWSELLPHHLLLFLFNILAGSVLTMIFIYTVPVLSPHYRRQVTQEQLVGAIILLSAAIAGIGSLEVYQYSIRNIAGSFFIMALALQGGVGTGTAIGAAVGMVIGLMDQTAAMAVALYSIAGLLAGTFNVFGKIAVALGYLGGCLIAISGFYQGDRLLTGMGEAAVASLFFLILPSYWWTALRGKAAAANPAVPQLVSGQLLQQSGEKLRNIAGMFQELAESLVSDRKQAATRVPEQELGRIIASIGDQVCKDCVQRDICWEENFYRTYQAILDLVAEAQSAKIEERRLPNYLQEVCRQKNQMLTTALMVTEPYRISSVWQKKMLENKRILAEQMKATSDIIGQLAFAIQRTPQYDRAAAAVIAEQAAIHECNLENVRVSGRYGSLLVEGTKQPCSGNQECRNVLQPLVSQVMGMNLAVESECGNKGLQRKCKLVMRTICRFAVEVGMSSVAKGHETESGDTYSVTAIGQEKVALILSDGMGSGQRAAGESRTAVQMVERLLTAGFEVDTAVRTVNSMLLLRLSGESYATMDMAVVDLYSGETEFLKVGCSASFVKRVREVFTIEAAAVPMGILQHTEIELVKYILAPGDIMVMVSDGVADAARRKNDKKDWVAHFLRLTASDNPQEIADLLLRQALEYNGKYATDDMTVLVAKLVECVPETDSL
ncbi:stage II sporulation protein E [Acetonema longum]|uniref:Protein serine/threonine phosphatase n=1 Tax=Acetonema longum DSM 6540 TaxID=1009370 RepID=F7NH62_9FIRM|nr:stage II sporulation protein E [Acetonema longum]EGO64545.1 protein serine/threonine phosphatase [Acetonema longum DSM 6540]